MAKHKNWIPFSGFFHGQTSGDLPVVDNSVTVPIFGLRVSDHLPFRDNYTVLASRGFWDFSLSLRLSLPPNAINGVFTVRVLEEALLDFQHPANNIVLNPLDTRDTQDCFVFEPLVRILGANVNVDPPFYSKAKRKVSKGQALAGFFTYAFDQRQNISSATLDVAFGCIGRFLIEY